MKLDYQIKGVALGVLSLFLLFTSCTDLEVTGTDSIITVGGDDGGNTDVNQLLEAAYNDLSAFTDQANIYSLFQHTSDELIPPTRGVDWGDNGVWRTLHAHTWDPTHAFVLGAWNQLNGRVFKTVEILASSPNAEQAAIANFLQGFYIWHVADLYGQVPFRDFDQGVGELPRVLSRSEAIDFAIDKVESAIANLPSKGPGMDNVSPNKAAAYAMLTRMYLNKAVYTASNPAGPFEHNSADLAKVIEYADLLAGEGYSYDSNFFDIFEAGSDSEPILVSRQGSPENRWRMTMHYNQTPDGWNGFTTIAEFYNTFDPNDPRIGEDPTPDGTPSSGVGVGFLIGQQVDDNGVDIIDSRSRQPLQFTLDVPLAGAATDKGVRAMKYHPSRSDRYVILRYAEPMLNKAEAQLRSGDNAGALATVNELRIARGAAALSSLDETAMLNERGFELYWEGLRRVDQVRFGTFTNTWSEKSVTDAFRVLFPIPQQALDSNPNLAQNEGY